MAAAVGGARLAAWGGRLRRGLAAGRRAWPSSGPVAAAVVGVALAGAGATWYHGRVNMAAPQGGLTVVAQKSVDSGEMKGKPSPRKQRFMQFSSLEHGGEYYMTPRDFLFSVMFDQIERKTLVKRLTNKDIEDVLAGIKGAGCGSTFFRDLGDKGLVSYTEYLFLLTILTKPHTGFHVAFQMLDADGDEMVEKKEFFKLQKIISKQVDSKTRITNETECQEPTVKEPEINTTLQIRFFGKRGERKLHYKEFRRFMENLQTEVQEMEFLQFSKGLSFMRKEDFAEWLLLFTNTENKDVYWKNVREKLSAGESISLDEFKSFCHFATHLEDFAIAMQMFSLAHRPVRLAEFKRAVKVATGQELSDNILDTVFKIFDLDGDECLSHEEFLGVLKNRMHRGLWVPQQLSIQEYWKCVKKESIKGVKEVWKQAGRGPL
ncbi:calcium uptake protein 2, mitochondrial-like [Lagenorhynchus albirostris]|uniref:calcium uptake protein 2, mitochondrial-like n=1 Tax=Lagenorhynchus albirostris TaxID=27610 RepID=UPI0028ED948F|nr:calcium uptake protein 2, mitochondrial-like [Lagenorhynchus albirostris]